MKEIFKWILILLTPIVLVYFIIIHVQIQRYSYMEVPKQADYLIILGAKVEGLIPSLSLQYRIDAAANYLHENQHTIAIASGGQGSGEDITEAEAIRNGLMEKGIDASRIQLEMKSTTTNENIQLSKSHLPEKQDIGIIVTNHYHVYRAVSIATDENMIVHGLSAKTPLISYPKAYLREYLAVSKYYVLKFFSKKG
ncbi:YdcF family protein [Halalkalibacter akibai]|uniref:DUF218 domain-containing protein n=1 Tax=Halalkalibacter akibai (strain ATCC 43226 / DSM 21942 / CIP 109018 / JCM 9157 / 1139) TaxID=1236973 RepID=W4QYJ6_HALA3|nr:YdcF family protein [Halalkalibacter akibai]GAE36957.1 hypothetical protein JCM9157_4195 [Halalkalibacter akibai JCM 9157]